MVKREETENQLNKHAAISSADGWNSLEFIFRKIFSTDNRELFLASMIIKGNFWQRQESLISVMEASLTKDYEVYLPQVIFPADRLREFVNNLEDWLVTFSDLEIELSDSSEQSLSVFIGRREDFISKLDRPVFSFKYHTSRMKAEWCFVTDPSCINLLVEGLTNVFENSR